MRKTSSIVITLYYSLSTVTTKYLISTRGFPILCAGKAIPITSPFSQHATYQLSSKQTLPMHPPPSPYMQSAFLCLGEQQGLDYLLRCFPSLSSMIPRGEAYLWGNILQDSRVILVSVLMPGMGREVFSINVRGLTFRSRRFSHHVNGTESFRFCQPGVREKSCPKTVHCIF